MKYLNILLISMLVTVGCRAQNIQPLEGPYNTNLNQPKPIYVKDVNNIRSSFVGVWRGSDGTKELTIYLYTLDDVPNGLFGPSGEQFKDGIMGYYIYKENGEELISSKQRLLNPHVPNKQQYGPIFGFTTDGIKMSHLRFVDYGIPIQNTDGSYGVKGGVASFTILNPLESQLEATFQLKNRPDAGTVIITNGQTIEPYNYDFSIPTDITLTKISNTPPPL